MKIVTLLAFLTINASAVNQNDLVNGRTITYFAIDKTTTQLTFSISRQVIEDTNKDNVRIIEALRLPDNSIIVTTEQFETNNNLELNNVLGTALDRVVLKDTKQFTTLNLIDKFTKFNWVTYRFVNDNGIWRVQNLGPVTIQFSFDEFFSVQTIGVAKIVDFKTLLTYIAKPTFGTLATIVRGGILIDPAMIGVRTLPGYALTVTDGETTRIFSNDLRYIDIKNKGLFIPTVNINGETIVDEVDTIIRRENMLSVDLGVKIENITTENHEMFERTISRNQSDNI